MAEEQPKPIQKVPFLKRLERRIDAATGYDLETEQGRRRARWNFNWMDHGILRVWWTNLYEVAPDVWRSNHPSPKRLERYKNMGIKTVINLRGTSDRGHYVFEKEACDALGLDLVSVRLAARNLVPRARYLELFDLFDSVEKPFVMHCKSGADRASLASALYLIHARGASVEEARKQFSFKYLHIKHIKTGILDHVLDSYEKAQKETGIGVHDWFKTAFDQKKLSAEYAAKRKA